jgi:hypothetical protein
VKIWIYQDTETGVNFLLDDPWHYTALAGPFEISYELYERIREVERQFDTMQDVMESLVYEWKYPEIDCD